MSQDEDAGERVYHVVPTAMAGDLLYPLNRLRALHADLAEAATRKYEGREALMRVRLPLLDCLWNDVIHLTPLHPSKTRRALEAAGFPVREIEFFSIPPTVLNGGAAVWFENSRVKGPDYRLDKEEFSIFDQRRYRELAAIPEVQHKYLEQAKRSGERPLFWARVPHVLYRGEIDVRGLKVVAWCRPKALASRRSLESVSGSRSWDGGPSAWCRRRVGG